MPRRGTVRGGRRRPGSAVCTVPERRRGCAGTRRTRPPPRVRDADPGGHRACSDRPPGVLLRTLTRLRTRGWACPWTTSARTLARSPLMPLLYPDVIKLDLRLLGERSCADIARVVTAVGAEAERRAGDRAGGGHRHARGAGARACAGTGYLLSEPGPLLSVRRPLRLARSGRRCRGRAAALPAGDQLAASGAGVVGFGGADGFAALGAGGGVGIEAGLLLAVAASPRLEALRGRAGVRGCPGGGCSGGHVDRDRLGPWVRRVLRGAARRSDWLFATSYDRELVVECALLLMARLG